MDNLIMLESAFEGALDQDEIKAIISSKKAKRLEKGLDFPVYYLEVNNRSMAFEFSDIIAEEGKQALNTYYPYKELLKLAQAAQERAKEQGYPVRFQLMAATSAEHHVPVDIELTDTSINMVCIESAGDSTVKACFEVICEAFRESYPRKKHNHYLIAPDIDGSDRVQFDSTSCSVFAMDILSKLTHMNPFQFLKRFGDKRKGIVEIPSHKVPSQLGFIFRGIQSLKAYEKLPNATTSSVITRGGRTLKNLISDNTRTVEREGANGKVKKPANIGIKKKRIGFLTDAQKHLEEISGSSIEEKQKVVDSRVDLKVVLESGTFLKVETAPDIDYNKIADNYLKFVQKNLSNSLNDKSKSRFSYQANFRAKMALEQARYHLAHAQLLQCLQCLLSIEKLDNIRLKGQISETITNLEKLKSVNASPFSLIDLKSREVNKAIKLFFKYKGSKSVIDRVSNVIHEYLSQKTSKLVLSRHNKDRALALLDSLKNNTADDAYSKVFEEAYSLATKGVHHKGLYASVIQLSLLELRQEIGKEKALAIESSACEQLENSTFSQQKHRS